MELMYFLIYFKNQFWQCTSACLWTGTACFRKKFFLLLYYSKSPENSKKEQNKKLFIQKIVFCFSFFIFHFRPRAKKNFFIHLGNSAEKKLKSILFFLVFSLFRGEKCWKVYCFGVFGPFSKKFFVFCFSFFIFHFRRIAKKNFFGFFSKKVF